MSSFEIDPRYEFDAPQYIDFENVQELDGGDFEIWFERHQNTPSKSVISLINTPLARNSFENIEAIFPKLSLQHKSTPKKGTNSAKKMHSEKENYLLMTTPKSTANIVVSKPTTTKDPVEQLAEIMKKSQAKPFGTFRKIAIAPTVATTPKFATKK